MADTADTAAALAVELASTSGADLTEALTASDDLTLQYIGRLLITVVDLAAADSDVVALEVSAQAMVEVSTAAGLTEALEATAVALVAAELPSGFSSSELSAFGTSLSRLWPTVG